MSTSFRFFTVDAFATQEGTGIFTGNPAGVVLIPKGKEISAETMQSIAAEVNLSETAFITPLEDLPLEEASQFGLRWFSPAVEVDLCGHGTLASAHTIFNILQNNSTSISFATRSGQLTSQKDPQTGMVTISLPANPPVSSDSLSSVALSRLVSTALGEDVVPTSTHYADILRIVLIHINGGEAAVRALKPDFKGMHEWGEKVMPGLLGVIVTSASDHTREDFVSRVFAPAVGIDEDPVTGAAHTVLAPYWAAILGRSTMRARQCSKRTGDLQLTLDTSEGKHGKVMLVGRSVTVVEGVFWV